MLAEFREYLKLSDSDTSNVETVRSWTWVCHFLPAVPLNSFEEADM